MRQPIIASRILELLTAALLLTACGGAETRPPDPVAVAEPSPVATAVVAAVAPAAPTAQVVPAGSVTSTPDPFLPDVVTPTTAAAGVSPSTAVTAAVPIAAANRLPVETKRWTLADGDWRISDFHLDKNGTTAYVTSYDSAADGAYRLEILDTQQGGEGDTYSVAGDRITNDPASGRLYLAPTHAAEGESPHVTVFDLATRTAIGELPGSRVAPDPVHNRVFVGDVPDAAGNTPQGVRLYDAATLELVNTGTQGGIPLYNPERDELVIVSNSAFTADPNSLAVRADLFPEISGAGTRPCEGCTLVADAYHLDGAQTGSGSLLVFDMAITSTGNGPGIAPKPVVLDAATLTPVTTTVGIGPGCATEPRLHVETQGVVLSHDEYDRYLAYDNLKALDHAGALLAFRDGLGDPFENAQQNVAYLDNGGATTLVLDRPTLDVVGVIPAYCFLTRTSDGRLFALDAARQNLVQLVETGGSNLSLPPQQDELALYPILDLKPSPGWADDGTLFAVASIAGLNGQALFRSTDRGETWLRLDSLPVGDGAQITFALSPAFASDGVLFAAGQRADGTGLGAWRSTDRGDSFTPVWHGLEGLRIDSLAVSPRFAEDNTLLAYGPLARIRPWEEGYSVQRTTDGGINWTTVMTAEDASLLPAPTVYLPITTTVSLPVRKPTTAGAIEVQRNGAWTVATGGLGAGEALVALLSTPGSATHEQFVITDRGVYRTQDDGATWTRWSGVDSEGEGETAKITAAALTPPDSSGAWQLLVAAVSGEGEAARASKIWSIDPATAQWDAAAIAGSPIEAGPTGTVTSSSALTLTMPPSATMPLTAARPMTASMAASSELAQTDRAAIEPAVVGTPVVEKGAGTAEAVAGPTATASPSTQPQPQAAGEPPAGLVVPGGVFAARWQSDPALQQALGFARSAEPLPVEAASQPFEHGLMVWVNSGPQIYVIADDKTWNAFPDTFKEGEPERDPNLYTPGELLQPVRGFGKLWRTQEGVRDRVGWAVSAEKGETALVQEFEHGLVLWAGNRVLVLLNDGTWR